MVSECTWTQQKRIAFLLRKTMLLENSSQLTAVHVSMIHGTSSHASKSQMMIFSIKNNIFMQSQKENSKWHTKRQINKAKKACDSHQMMMFLSALDFKNAIKMNHIDDCPLSCHS